MTHEGDPADIDPTSMAQIQDERWCNRATATVFTGILNSQRSASSEKSNTFPKITLRLKIDPPKYAEAEKDTTTTRVFQPNINGKIL